MKNEQDDEYHHRGNDHDTNDTNGDDDCVDDSQVYGHDLNHDLGHNG